MTTLTELTCVVVMKTHCVLGNPPNVPPLGVVPVTASPCTDSISALVSKEQASICWTAGWEVALGVAVASAEATCGVEGREHATRVVTKRAAIEKDDLGTRGSVWVNDAELGGHGTKKDKPPTPSVGS